MATGDLIEDVRKLVAANDYVGAIDLGLAALRDRGADAALHGLVGFALYQVGDHPQAIPCLRRAIDIDPFDYHSQLFLGRSLQAMGEMVAALRHYWAACEVNPALAHQPLEFALPLVADALDSEEAAAFMRHIESRANTEPDFARYLLRISVLAGQLGAVRAFLDDPQAQDFLASSPARPGLSTQLLAIRSVRDWIGRHGDPDDYREIGAAEEIPYARLGRDGEPYVEKHVTSMVPYVAALRNVSVIGDASLVFDQHGQVISDLLTHPEYGRFASMEYHKCVLAQHEEALLVELPVPYHRIAEGVMLSGSLSSAFGHWFSEFLPKLANHVHIPGFPGIPLIVDAGMPDSHYQYLRLLVDNELVILPRGQRLEVDKLWVSPTTTFKPGNFLPGHNVPYEQRGGLSPRALRFLRDRVLRAAPDDDGTRRPVYVSRSKTANRVLLNEAKVIEKLAAMGFTIAYPQDMSFMEQVCLFRGASRIVAPSGSALNNLIFADPGTDVLIIQTEHYNWGMGIGPLMALGYRPRFIKGQGRSGVSLKDANYSVDIQELEAALAGRFGAGVAPTARSKQKVFCIGRNKTGTTSIAAALAALGYSVGDQVAAELLMDDWANRDFHRIVDYCRTADAFQDVPFSLDYTYAILDYAFPGSKFILTVRSSGDEWFESLIRFHSKAFCNGRLPTADDLKAVDYRHPGWLWRAHTMIYGNDETNLYHRENYIRHYESHNARVMEYFKRRPQDLLVLNLAAPDSMQRLCRFLGIDPANHPSMPHLNASA